MATPTHQPTESTPLSPSASNTTQTYQTHQATNPRTSSCSSSSPSSSDSGGGYISGSGRRESTLERRPKKKTSSRKKAASSSRQASSSGLGNPTPVSSSIQWASSLDASTTRTRSPAVAAVSPGRKETSTAVTGSMSNVVAADSFLHAESRRRSREGSDAKPATASSASGGRRISRGLARDEPSHAGDKGEGSWFHRLVEKYGAIELDNKGSVARDHLALERTFLAWLRTSLAFASIGIGITQLFRLNTTLNPSDPIADPPSSSIPVVRLRTVGKPLGVTFLAISIVILCLGWRRYFEAQYWIIRGKFPASRGSIFLVTFVAAALIVVSLAVVVIVGKGM